MLAMQTPVAPSKASQPNARPPVGRVTLFHLILVFGVALILATLFTAWTPTDESSQPGLVQDLNLTPIPTPISADAPDATALSQLALGIVAGHWNNDSGAVCSDGLREVDINLHIATLVQKLLVENGYRADLLNEFDPRLNAYKAAALVSIHADSCDYVNNQATGFKVASALASPRPERASRLAACLSNRYALATGLSLHSTSITVDMTSYHAFDEIDENTPAVIIETGFMNLDRQFLTQTPELAAQGIFNGILCFMRNESISAPTPQTTP